MAIAWWALRRLGSRVLEPIPLVSLLATSLSLRLVFEEGLFGYKFLALGVMLLLLAIVRGRIRPSLVAWLAFAALAFNPIPGPLSINGRSWGAHVGSVLPLAGIVVALVLIVYNAAERRVRWYLVAWFVIAACSFLQWPLWQPDSVRAVMPIWILQLVLLPTGVVMAVSPLVNSIRTAGPNPPVSPENNATLSRSAVTQQPDNWQSGSALISYERR